MADIEVAEYTHGRQLGARAPAPSEPHVAFQLVSYTTSAQSNAFSTTTTLVRVKARTARAYIAFGAAPVATAAGSKSVEQNVVEYFVVRPGDKMAAYDGSS